MKIELDLSNYVTKAYLKNTTGVDTSKFAKKVGYLANLKSNVDELDIDKLKNVPNGLSNLKSKVHKLDVDKLAPVPVDLSKLAPAPVDSSKLSDVVKKDVAKKDLYNAKTKNIENKIPDITKLTATTITALNDKITEFKNKYLVLLT